MIRLFLLAYNIISISAAVLFAPVWLPLVLLTPKYRLRIGERLGWKLRENLKHLPIADKRVFWIHALSVGETTSILPLVKGLRKQHPADLIVLSATTRSGCNLAKEIAGSHVDAVIPAPLDFYPVVCLFIRIIRPSLFILTETDFWPNWQLLLSNNGIPTVLVNGRISAKSFATYSLFSFFFRPFFSSFTALCMQSGADESNLVQLGVPPDKISTLGNLKLDTFIVSPTRQPLAGRKTREKFGMPADGPIWIAGSTHPGEEAIILKTYQRLRQTLHPLYLIIAPRDIARGGEIQSLAASSGFSSRLRSDHRQQLVADILILDTIGELACLYKAADAAFVGGSLVPCGGHNPLEPAALGIPVVFGQHMEDFPEIASSLVLAGGAVRIENEEGLYRFLLDILQDQTLHDNMSAAARTWVADNQGVVARHLSLLSRLLTTT